MRSFWATKNIGEKNRLCCWAFEISWGHLPALGKTIDPVAAPGCVTPPPGLESETEPIVGWGVNVSPAARAAAATARWKRTADKREGNGNLRSFKFQNESVFEHGFRSISRFLVRTWCTSKMINCAWWVGWGRGSPVMCWIRLWLEQFLETGGRFKPWNIYIYIYIYIY